MTIQEQLKQGRSKPLIEKIVKHVCANPTDFKHLLTALDANDSLAGKNAAWVISHLGKVMADQLISNLTDLTKWLVQEEKHKGTRRGVLRALSHLSIPNDQLGHIVDLCFGILENSQSELAHKAFAIDIVLKAAKKYPELLEELRALKPLLSQHASAGMRSKLKTF